MKVNVLKKVVYVALNFSTGISDLILTVRKPDGSLLSPISLVEQGDGVYTAEYTPDVVGTWQEKISSVLNADRVFRSTNVEVYDIEDVKNQTSSIETKIDSIKTKTDNLPANTATTLTNIQSSINNLGTEIRPGGYFA